MRKTTKAVMFLSTGNQPNPEMLKATKLLVDARNQLLYAKGDFGGCREDAIQHINNVVDEIRAFEENGRHHSYGQSK